jgi:hypothetical protein
MAIDGVNLRVFGVDPSLWLNCDDLAGLFAVKVNPKTGKPISGVKKAQYKGLRFEIKPYPDGKTGMTIRGSLHKYFNNGSHNCNKFTFNDLCLVVADLECRFGVLPDQAVIENIEIGVNIEVPFAAKKVLTSLICYSDKTFEAMDGRLPLLGRICPSNDFDIKIYDKVAQSVSLSSLPPEFYTSNIIRFEISTRKMRWLSSCEIRTLADLVTRGKLNPTKDLILAVLNKIVFVDIDADVSLLSDSEKALYGLFRDRDKWRRFDKRKRYKMRHRLPVLLSKCNGFDYANLLQTLVVDTWRDLFQEAEKEGLLHQLSDCQDTSEAIQEGTISPLEYNGTIVPFLPERREKEKKRPETNNRKVCRCCGKDISEQKPNSVFCSEKYKGKEAKKCRNQDSNNRRDKKRVIMKAKDANQYLVIGYMWNGVLYSDTLHASEVGAGREFLDNVVSVTVKKDISSGEHPAPDIMVYSEARDYLRQLTERNGLNSF